jgi:hypothetical protein
MSISIPIHLSVDFSGRMLAFKTFAMLVRAANWPGRRTPEFYELVS